MIHEGAFHSRRSHLLHQEYREQMTENRKSPRRKSVLYSLLSARSEFNCLKWDAPIHDSTLSLLIFFFLSLICTPSAFAELKTGMAAEVVIGQEDFSTSSSGTSQNKLNSVIGVWSTGSRVIVGDQDNRRALIFNPIPEANFANAATVVGQPNFTSRGFSTTQTGGGRIYGVTVAGGRLFVMDPDNDRCLIWNSVPDRNGAPADVVVGQPDFTTSGPGTDRTSLDNAQFLSSDGKRFIIADDSNRRVLIWNKIPASNNELADIVLGQPDFTSNTNNNGGLSARSMSRPNGVAFDGQRLFVADSFNNLC